MKRFITVAVLLALAGCNRTFYKDGATQQDWAQVKYRCAQESSTRTNATAYCNPYVNVCTASSGQQLDMDMMTTCLNAHGWYEH